MPLSKQDVDHIAQLARLHLSDEEQERYRQQLSDILDHVGKLQELDTTDVPAMDSIVVPQCRLRPDEPEAAMPRTALLANAPEAAEQQFKVPPVLDGDV
ncbi:MAG: Asp-tRNA(Asn)/Glu-tRNA(Gln) amidotransferase subunit GatC [Anaerolineales bacterium]|jgi:aspartyl-tRNA(Asn)/glutamyl-tRNA(Gln) amidotransferase subunit C|nr:Asp-tRNA(Asn)/Glu-tRNA(Gln) amidotransferase subunit GatC [Anaerolineales bacterium]MCW5839362.1 Asp-tRNA(Asn)/Glu-tRNA(Gln) amidotransferase subunit GatC [Anaerolineales bacterium]MCW5888213.1 Asp-tRNA(Asn)/Glu-tRNA(Gln) amidotransferase subunit GatC [Anaerolineales bacterium]